MPSRAGVRAGGDRAADADAVQLALKNYPALKERRARAQAAAEGVDVARTAYLPRLDMVWQENRATANNVFVLLLPQAIVPPISGSGCDDLSGERQGASCGTGQGRVTPRFEAIPHLKRAIELDPDFAMALALLSGLYANLGKPALAPALSRRAFELRDRVSERERFFISWRYYRDSMQAWDKGLELARSWAATYPRDMDAFNSEGVAANELGQHEQALDAFREAIRLDPQAALPRLNMANALFSLNRFGETKQVLRQAEGMHDQLIDVRRLQYLLAFVEGDHAAMSGYLADALKMPEAIATADWEARASAFAGRLHAAHDQFSRAIETVLQAGFTAIAGDWTIEDAESHAVAGQCREARKWPPRWP